MKKAKFKVGDKVRIINYGHMGWSMKKRNIPKCYPIKGKDMIGYWFDTAPELIGKTGIVNEVTIIQGISMYSLKYIKGKCAWYYDAQLELIERNKNGC